MNDGGPAFPTPDCSEWDGDTRTPGMSLRDWFAGHEARGVREDCRVAGVSVSNIAVAVEAYRRADAMIEARSLNPKPHRIDKANPEGGQDGA